MVSGYIIQMELRISSRGQQIVSLLDLFDSLLPAFSLKTWEIIIKL